ncbi:autotransporter outer membrane beta-barrel domain-containing protein [Aquirhabdus parva]|uniref:Uncharacterized protein n=1 Tax=Aquirhabdus parva TaxID=2283318 RepID=A0A345P976_9GAMM|nr:hypothetical protein [Aquirhabdus parva]AXI03835.1 hypothetical protein HYN46_13925 [Aquirhabdus parva]
MSNIELQISETVIALQTQSGTVIDLVAGAVVVLDPSSLVDTLVLSRMSAISSGLSIASSSVSTISSGLSIVASTVSNTTSILSALSSGFSTIRSSVSAISSGLTTTNTAVSTLSAGLSNISTSLSNTTSAVSAVSSGLSTARSSVSAVSSGLSSVSSGLSSVNSAVSALSSGLSMTISGVSSVSSGLSSVSTGLSNSTSAISAVSSGLSSTIAQVTVSLSNTNAAGVAISSGLSVTTSSVSAISSSLSMAYDSFGLAINNTNSAVSSISSGLSITTSSVSAVSSGLAALGSMATQNASTVNITGGAITTTGGVTIDSGTTGALTIKSGTAVETNFLMRRIGANVDEGKIQIRHLGTAAFDIRSLNDAGSSAHSILRAERSSGISWSMLQLLPISGQVVVGANTVPSADKFGVVGRGYFSQGLTSVGSTDIDGTTNGGALISNATTGQAQLTFVKKGAAVDEKNVDFLLAPSGSFIMRTASDNWANGTTEIMRAVRGTGINVTALQLLPTMGQVLMGTSSASGGDKLRVSGSASFLSPTSLGKYTLSTLPSAAAFNGYLIDVTDATGGAKTCRSNGTNWQILNTTTTVA